MRLRGALDHETHAAVVKFIESGTPPDVVSLYSALQKSNSSLKRQNKKALQASIERVLDVLTAQRADEPDSDAIIEDAVAEIEPPAELMNRSLRANLAGPPRRADGPPSPSIGEDGPKRRKANGESLPKRQKRNDDSRPTAITDTSLADVGGMNNVIDQLIDNLLMPYTLFRRGVRNNGSTLPKGILFQGPPGCGKTMLVRALAAEIEVPFIEILGPSIVSGMSGESEKGIREKFEEAKRNAPCLMFIDEIDAIAPKRDTSQSQMEKRIVAQLLVSMDELQRDTDKPVFVLAATNRPDSLDPALRRGGRFGTEVNIGVPDEHVRKRILEVQTRNMLVSKDVDMARLAKMTAGYVGADLMDLVGKASAHMTRRLRVAIELQATEQSVPYEPMEAPAGNSFRKIAAWMKMDNLQMPAGFGSMQLAMQDFEAVLPTIIPSSKREGFTTIPDVSWKDIGALESVREALQANIVDPIQRPQIFEALGISTPSGVLLWGPPGCGKTLLAKAAAAESRANFISIKGPELLNKFVGESEAAVRRVFQRARSSVPCVIFFDELDALVPKRDDGGSEASSRVVNTLLTELDGLSDRAGIYIIGATNRPDMIDSAMLRPGRLGQHLFVDLPGAEERVDILKALVRGKQAVEYSPRLQELVRDKCLDYSGADLGALLQQAGMNAVKRVRGSIDIVGSSSKITFEDFELAAATQVVGSVKDAERYRRLRSKFGR